MAEKKKPIGELRKELQHLLLDLKVAPSKMKSRGDIEQLIGVYSKFSAEKKAVPPAPREKGGRKKAAEVEGAEKDGIAVPKKLVKEKTQYAVDKEKKAKATIKPGKLDDDDSGTGSESEAEEKKAKVSSKKVEKAAVEPTSAPAEKKKRVISPEHLAKMKAAREAKKAAGDAAKPKKEDAPAKPKKEKSVKEKPETKQDDNTQYIKLPVFNLG
jgi:hypothetical protein